MRGIVDRWYDERQAERAAALERVRAALKSEEPPKKPVGLLAILKRMLAVGKVSK